MPEKIIGFRVFFDPQKGRNVAECIDKKTHDNFIHSMRVAFSQADRRRVKNGDNLTDPFPDA